MPIVRENDYVVVPGKVDIFVAFSPFRTNAQGERTTVNSEYGYERLYKLGESEDSIRVAKQPSIEGVPGDRHGGRSGPPIERQFLGMSVSFELSMSRWDQIVVAEFERMGGLLPRAGRIPLNRVGALLHQDYGVRVLLFSQRSVSQSINIPCCTWAGPHTVGKGTKFSQCSMAFEGSRVDRGSWQALYQSKMVNELYNRDIRGLDEVYLTQLGINPGLVASYAAEIENAIDF